MQMQHLMVGYPKYYQTADYALRLRMQKSYRASWISLAICQHMSIAVSGRYSDGSPEMKACRS